MRALLSGSRWRSPRRTPSRRPFGPDWWSNLVEPAAERLRDELRAANDDRAIQVTQRLDAVRSSKFGSYAAGEDAAMQLVRWITQWTPT